MYNKKEKENEGKFHDSQGLQSTGEVKCFTCTNQTIIIIIILDKTCAIVWHVVHLCTESFKPKTS